MSRTVKLGHPRNPVQLETALGLARGKVLSMTENGGDIEVMLDDSVNWPDSVLQDKLEKALGRKVK